MIRLLLSTIILSLACMSCTANNDKPVASDQEILGYLVTLLYSDDPEDEKGALLELDRNWEEGMVAPLVEIMRFSTDRDQLRAINKLLSNKTGKSYSQFFEWGKWLWEAELALEPYYYNFKAEIYKNIDPRFYKYFRDREGQANIRLEEVVWGGVEQDGIPPLRQPKLLTANEQDYLSDSDIVFGAYINGVPKAYPKRILAWHEMFVDDFGDDTICGVYCTLCGTVIAYDTEYEGKKYNLGTSGFLYRSNKLMYDKETQTLWNTLEGKPVLGPLHNSGVELNVRPIVTTTWGEWKKLHPLTEVLSLETGHRRDYGEGVAYQAYFATDELMFPVPKTNTKLKNKDEVLIIRTEGYRTDPLAISIKYLKKKKWHTGTIAGTPYIVIADKTGAARVYDSKGHDFKSYKKGKLSDNNGNEWTVTHNMLTGPNGETLERLPSHNTFWFAWYNTYPKTTLIK